MAELVAGAGSGGGDGNGDARRPEACPRVTWEGCSVLLDINDGDRLVFARLSPAASLKIGNKKLLLSPLIGCPFGSLFRVETGPGGPRLERCIPASAAASDKFVQEIDDGCIIDDAKDNRSLIDNNTAQCLSGDDIDALKRAGATGDEIVEALIANSSTYDKKTAYSQEKYKLKKQKKYAPKVLLRRPSARSICDTYFKKHPTRIGSLRADTLSLLLSLASVGAYSDVLVVDMVGGIVTGAVAERLGGTGSVCCTYFGASSHPIDIIRMFNFNSEVCNRIFQTPFSDLCKSHNNLASDMQLDANNSTLPDESASSESLTALSTEEINQELDPSLLEHSVNTVATFNSSQNSKLAPLASESCSTSNTFCIQGNNTFTNYREGKAGKLASLETIDSWKERGFTSLIIAAPEWEVGRIVEKLLPLLSYSAPFAIYHQCLQPLATCMHRLQTSKMAINLQISEAWLREYQVLPSRTHPMMQMSGFGGYILSGIRICDDETCNGNK